MTTDSVAPKHGPKRRHMLAEYRLLSEWLAANYAGRTWHLQYRVGADPDIVGVQVLDEAERRLARNVNRQIDAVVEPPPDLLVIEATMYRPTEKIGRLQEYLLLLPASPEWPSWERHELVPVLLTAQHDPVAAKLCESLRFRYVFWEPEWIDEFYAVYPARRRRAPHSGIVDASMAISPLNRFLESSRSRDL
jgi:hypothetical protein